MNLSCLICAKLEQWIHKLREAVKRVVSELRANQQKMFHTGQPATGKFFKVTWMRKKDLRLPKRSRVDLGEMTAERLRRELWIRG
jgi:hypothetical protein